VAFFEGVDDRTQAESLVKAILWVEDDSDSAPVEDNAWFDHQLVGLQVRRDGEQIGTLIRVDHLPAQDLLAVETAQGEVLLPFVTAFVPEVNTEDGYIAITPPGGLFEEVDADGSPD